MFENWRIITQMQSTIVLRLEDGQTYNLSIVEYSQVDSEDKEAYSLAAMKRYEVYMHKEDHDSVLIKFHATIEMNDRTLYPSWIVVQEYIKNTEGKRCMIKRSPNLERCMKQRSQKTKMHDTKKMQDHSRERCMIQRLQKMFTCMIQKS